MNDTRELGDQEIVRLVCDGDRDAFRVVVARYERVVSALGRRMQRSEADVTDFVQDVFLKAYLNLRQYAGRGRFYSWLLRIAYTTALNRARRVVPEVPADPAVLDRIWTAPERDNPEDQMLHRLLLEAIAHAIQELPRHSALAVELFFFCGLRYAEIAEITDIPVNTLKSHIRRARLLLQRKLAGTIAEDFYDLQ
jgi:RNA polymerase sigma-70 factor, ECF subfamily